MKVTYFLQALKKYYDWSGRAQRAEYWYFMLFFSLGALVLGLIEGLIGAFPDTDESILGLIFVFAMLAPCISVTIRRLHDIGRSGWYYWLYFIPFIGVIVLFVFTVTDSQSGENEYGPNPKGL